IVFRDSSVEWEVKGASPLLISLFFACRFNYFSPIFFFSISGRMNSGAGGGEVGAPAAAGPPSPLEWKFSQVFGERTAGEEVQEVDIISAIEFDKSGDHLATGDRGGRVVLFERTDMKE
ncbi:hypothetical protein M569_15553, partial [Genlisea aurea]